MRSLRRCAAPDAAAVALDPRGLRTGRRPVLRGRPRSLLADGPTSPRGSRSRLVVDDAHWADPARPAASGALLNSGPASTVGRRRHRRGRSVYTPWTLALADRTFSFRAPAQLAERLRIAEQAYGGLARDPATAASITRELEIELQRRLRRDPERAAVQRAGAARRDRGVRRCGRTGDEGGKTHRGAAVLRSPRHARRGGTARAAAGLQPRTRRLRLRARAR